MNSTVPSPALLPRPGVSTAPRGHRARLAQALDAAGLLDRMLWLRGALRMPALTVLTYHRVGVTGDVGELDPGVVDVSPADLAEQIEVIRAHGSVVTMADVRRLLRDGRALPPNPVLIAFDDGYLDNHDVALPILARAGVPATFFIPTAFPDGGRLFWWDRIALLLRRCVRPRVSLSYPTPCVLEPLKDPGGAAKTLYRAVKRTPGLDLGRLWEELEARAGVALDAAEERTIAERTIMGWPQVRALRSAGMDVQSHSHAHRVLGTLSPAEALRDLRRSREVLGEALGEPVHGVAYPVGYALRGAFRSAVVEAGFEVGFTNATGLCVTSRIDPLNIPRIAMDVRHVGALYKLLLLLG